MLTEIELYYLSSGKRVKSYSVDIGYIYFVTLSSTGWIEGVGEVVFRFSPIDRKKI
jgi:hypothetical protein